MRALWIEKWAPMSLILPADPEAIGDPGARGPAKRRAESIGVLGLSAPRIWVMIALSALASAGLMARAELTIDPWSPSNIPYCGVAMLVLILRVPAVQQRLPHGRAIADAAAYCLMFTAIALIGAVTSYPVAALSHGFADAALQRVDLALRFDWLAWYRLVAGHIVLQWAGIAAYESIYLTPAIMLGWFAFRDDKAGAYRFLASFWLAAVVTLAAFSQMPAIGPFAYLWRDPIPYMPRSELWQPDLIPVLRAHALHVVDLGQLRGLVSAPSFHAAAAAIYIATAWHIPRLRWILVPLNLAMLLSTPVEGTHYLADIILGVGIAIAAMAVIGAMFPAGRTARRPV